MVKLNDIAEFLVNQDRIEYMKFLVFIDDSYISAVLSSEIIVKAMNAVIDNHLENGTNIDKNNLKKEIYNHLKVLESEAKDEYNAIVEAYEEYMEKLNGK